MKLIYIYIYIYIYVKASTAKNIRVNFSGLFLKWTVWTCARMIVLTWIAFAVVKRKSGEEYRICNTSKKFSTAARMSCLWGLKDGSANLGFILRKWQREKIDPDCKSWLCINYSKGYIQMQTCVHIYKPMNGIYYNKNRREMKKRKKKKFYLKLKK